MAPDVSILMPAYAAEQTLPRALACALGQRTTRSLEVLVVDDGSPDRTRAIADEAARVDERVRVLSQPNGGEAKALNTGWKQARGRYVAILEADVEAESEWLEVCLAVLEKEPEAWAVGGYLETPREDSWIARLAGYEVEAKFRTKPRMAKHLTSANVLYRAEAFELAGPFDERLVNASLDSVFNGRLTKAGKQLVYEPAARVRHHYKTSLLGFLRRQWAYARYRVHNEVLDLYPADRFLAVHVALAALAALALTLVPLGWVAPQGHARTALFVCGPGLLALALLAQVPRTLALLARHRDPALLLWPAVATVRNVVGALGYAVGLGMKTIGRT